MDSKSQTGKATRVLATAAMLALLVASLSGGVALAAKGGGGKPGGGTTGGGTITLRMVADANGNGAPNWADEVTYTVSTTATVYPYVSTTCTQNGILVLSTSAGFFPSYAWPSAQIVPLKTDRWTGGAASCTAKLYSMDSGSQSILKTLSFSVGS